MKLYYDGECPFCSRYVALLQLRESVGAVELIDLRTDPAASHWLVAQGALPDQGMTVELDGRLYTGDDAVNRLALLSTSSGAFNRLNHALFRHAAISTAMYPLLRAGRNASLFLLGRKPIQPETDPGQLALYQIFSVMWGVFAFLHFLVYAYQYNQPIYATTVLTPLLGVMLVLHPGSRRLFVALLMVMLVDGWLHMPIYSNHTIIKNVLLLAMLLAGGWQWLRGGTWQAFFAAFSVVGRCLLLTMYFFGVFHKINSGFLDPQVSCAVTLWHQMPAPLSQLDTPAFRYLAIYGSLVIEAAIFCMLLTRRYRHLGILVGVGFHMMLALSAYAMYTPFSMLSVVLHCLFLSPESSRRIVASQAWRRIQGTLHQWKGRTVFLIWTAIVYVLAWNSSYSLQAIVWIIGILPFWYAIATAGRDECDAQIRNRHLLFSKNLVLNLLSAAFFLNCITPYLGLKTAQSINMFANLRLEAGASNHLLLRNAPAPFGYLEDTVEITGTTGSPYLTYLHQNRLHAVYYDLLDALDRNPGAGVSYIRAGRVHSDQSAQTLAPDISTILHRRWVRNWFHFAPVDLNSPKRCALDR